MQRLGSDEKGLDMMMKTRLRASSPRRARAIDNRNKHWRDLGPYQIRSGPLTLPKSMLFHANANTASLTSTNELYASILQRIAYLCRHAIRDVFSPKLKIANSSQTQSSFLS
jgi:hypothetical protein